MIQYTNGDMFDLPVDIRVNTVNCKGVMGAGVALAFKTRYPDMYREYRAQCDAGKLRPGQLHVWKNLMGDWVVNFPTKRHWRENSRYDDIDAGLDALRDYLRDKGNVRVALPALGCGNGKLDWDRVSPMIQQKLGELDAHIFVFEPGDSLRAAETTVAELSDETMRRLEALGYVPLDLPQHLSRTKEPASALVNGNAKLLTRGQWIALLPSSQPGDREMTALQAIARQLAMRPDAPAVALARTARASDSVASLFAEAGVEVILIHPFVPPGDESSTPPTTRITQVSLGGTNRKWSKALAVAATDLLRRGARSTLLADPSPDWMTAPLVHQWNQHALHFVHYGAASGAALQHLREQGIPAIGRRSDTGAPNLDPLLQAAQAPQPIRSFATATAAQLRELAEALDRNGSPGASVFISVGDDAVISNEMRSAIQRILPELA